MREEKSILSSKKKKKIRKEKDAARPGREAAGKVVKRTAKVVGKEKESAVFYISFDSLRNRGMIAVSVRQDGKVRCGAGPDRSSGAIMPRIKKPNAKTVKTAKTSKPAKVKPVGRRTGWEWRSPCGQYGVIEITADSGDTKFYLTTVLSPNCVEMSYTDSPGKKITYTVFFGKTHFCGCETFRYSPTDVTGQQTCKHIKALTAMREAGRL